MGFCLQGGAVLGAKERSGILAQAWAKVPEMMCSQRKPALLSFNNKCTIQFQLPDKHEGSLAMLALQNGRRLVQHG